MKLDYESVKNHLEYIYNYPVKESDTYLIRHLIHWLTDYILTYCNRRDIPERLVHSVLDYICGRFLYFKKSQGDLVDENGDPIYDFDSAESSIQLGNAQVNFQSSGSTAGLSAEAQYDALLADITNSTEFKHLLNHYRKIKWK